MYKKRKRFLAGYGSEVRVTDLWCGNRFKYASSRRLPAMITSFCLALTLLASMVELSSTFVVPSSIQKGSTTSLHSLVKKGKLKEVASFIESLQNKDMENENKEVLQFMESGKRPVGLGAHYDFFNSTMNRFSSITIMVSFIMPFSHTLSLLSI